jgi:hypothetical protein
VSLVTLAEAAPSAGGAPLDQLLIVGAFTTAAYFALIWVILRERSGRPTLIGRAASLTARLDGSPRWFLLPTTISILGALSGAVGLYWDVSYHIEFGRDEGPLANPSHYFIFLGLLAIFFGGALGMALRDERLPERTLKISRQWRAPLGPTVATGIALCALAGFPLDDLWHRLFGQDVTEWGPTHVLMIGGTVMLPYGALLTVAEAKQVSRSRVATFVEWIGVLILAAGPVAFNLEYSYGVPQFPLINDPLVLTLAAVPTFAVAMHHGAKWVVGIWLAYAVLESALTGLNMFAWDALTPRQPLLIGAAAAALLLARFARPTVAFGAVSGLLIAEAMLATEFFWVGATRPIPWPAEMMPLAALFVAILGAGLGVVSAWVYQQSGAVTYPQIRPRLIPGVAAFVAFAAAVGVLAFNIPPKTSPAGEVSFTVGTISRGEAVVDVEIDPDLVADSYWFNVTSWQGGGMVRTDLVEVSPGHYRTEKAVPLTGDWKTLFRLHLPTHDLMAAPIYMPADEAIPAPEVPAVSDTRAFVQESLILRREQKPDLPGWLWGVGYGVVGVVFAILFGVTGLGYVLAGSPRSAGRIAKRVDALIGAGR